jgi:threonine dehydrogenase-like Zn-dependent dehydrogenase
MRQVHIHGPRDVRVDEAPRPTPGPRDAVVRVVACGICGTDLGYLERGGQLGRAQQPMPIGHEIAGVVSWVGTEVASVRVGERVVVHPGDDEVGRIGNGGPEGGLCEELLVRNAARGDRLFAVPAALPLEVAAFAEPLAVGMHAAEQLEPRPGDTVAVFGCGPIGLAAIASLRSWGIDRVVGVDLSERRLELAANAGAEAALNPARDDVWAELARLHGTARFMTGVTPATTCFIEASGAPRVIGDVLARGRVGGRLSVVALHHQPIPTNYLLLLMKQFTIRGSMEYPKRFEAAVELLAARDLSALITHRFPLDAFDRALGVLSGSKECGKVLIQVASE